MAKALERCQGVNVAVTAFPADDINPEACAVAPLVRHGQRVHDNFMNYAVWIPAVICGARFVKKQITD